mmetsp:Transcript_70048/g.167337  ORF Transcript_70048/g.167337 Transcript_70048/m.167337 type:complete len:210 (+) Transcript_70048:85-714(+)|eukprot:CAMPEP_0181454476 /NCGR_PEP_ID=MMETSP1110-20121109/30256_1 /TAXON_ID=174948 /ORGANISM="Symbiodinium sp., Strain CCMP421" /LENGTH=209 /DNA_ID=CAMNT_0023578819 /DNA_START=75 /DNA_END=704 /DNA_ORIENTATION=-
MARTKSEVLKASQASGKTKGTKKSGKTKGKTQAAASSSGQLVSDGAEGAKRSPGSRAKQEVRFYQASTELLVPKTNFQRLVREICGKLGPYRFEVQALLALQEAAETFLTGLMEDASLFCLHGRRVTVMQRDLQLSRRIRSYSSAGSRFTAEGASKKEDKDVLADGQTQAIVPQEVEPGATQTDTQETVPVLQTKTETTVEQTKTEEWI